MGVEDQGWVAWFCIALVTGRPLSIYGDGLQVRDVLHVADLLDAYDRIVERIYRVKGQAYNLGGGPRNAIGILETAQYIAGRLGVPLDPRFEAWRAGDQRVYVSDIRKAERDLGWTPARTAPQVIDDVLAWVQANRFLFEARPDGA
jgi:CDP-paratose 2-epimerase